MKSVAKYNVCKSVSSVLTIGTPIVTLACSSVEIVTPEGKMSITACIVLLLTLLFCKDKIAENFKVPSAFVLSGILFGIIIMIENILVPMKAVLIATMIASGVDELTFKRMYKSLESLMPARAKAYKHIGFYFTTSEKVNALGE